MTQAHRLAALLDLLHDRGTLSNTEIGTELGVSEATTRRYLAILEESHMLTRTHGGAVARGSGLEWSLQARSGRRIEDKQRIARAAVGLLGENETLALNGGTTTAEVARQLAARHSSTPTTLVTTAVNIAYELAPRPEFSVLLTGGSVRTISLEMIGPVAEATLADVTVDTAIIGVDGIDPKRGVTNALEMEASTLRGMVRQAQRTIVVADATKIGRAAFVRVCDIADIDILVTDSAISPELISEFEAQGPRVVIADDERSPS